MIKPTVGRNVHYFPQGDDPVLAAMAAMVLRDYTKKVDPLVALLCGVVDDRTVNLAVFGPDGSGPYSRKNVELVQEGNTLEEGVSYAAWMDYQKGQAAKNEQLEQKLVEASNGFLGDAAKTDALELQREELKGKLEDKLKELQAQSANASAGDSDKGASDPAAQTGEKPAEKPASNG